MDVTTVTIVAVARRNETRIAPAVEHGDQRVVVPVQIGQEQGFCWMPSCTHVTASQNSSNVPKPPGRAMKPLGELGHEGLALVHRADDAQVGDPAVRDLALLEGAAG